MTGIVCANNVVLGALTATSGAASVVALNTGSFAGVGVALDFSAAVGATAVFEKSVDGTNWDAVNAKAVGSGGTFVSSATATGRFDATGGSSQSWRVRLTALTSGTVAVVLLGTLATAIQGVVSGNQANFLVTATSGAVASDGVLVPVDSLAQTLTYNTNGTLNTITVTYLTHTYVQTYSYNSSSQLTGISNWVQTS